MSTRNYRVDGVVASLAIKSPCRVKTTANITLSATQTIDGVTVAVGDRVLVGSQTDASENGIYDVAANDWTRAKDFDGPRDVTTGTFIYVNAGTTHADTFWKVTSADDPIVVGTSDITIESISVTGPQGEQGEQGPPGADGTIDLSSLTNETTVDPANDELLMRDADEGANNAITVQVLYNAINALTAETAVDSADILPVYDSSGSTTNKATVSNVIKSITTLTDATITASDEIVFCDVDDSNNPKKDTVQGILDLAGGTGLIDRQVFTSSGTWTKPAGTTKVIVRLVGGGGGSAGQGGSGGTGGTTSFGAHCQATGGTGGNISTYSTGGIGSGGDLNLRGDDGGMPITVPYSAGSDIRGGAGGASKLGASVVGTIGASGTAGYNYGGGASGGDVGTAGAFSTGGAGGGYSEKYIDSGLASSETVTVGAGGTAGATGTANPGSAGAPGVVIVESYG